MARHVGIFFSAQEHRPLVSEFNFIGVRFQLKRCRLALLQAGKLLIHPGQIMPARRAFLPDPAEIEWARRILEMAGTQTGVLTVDGRMVDAPVLKRANQILARAKPV